MPYYGRYSDPADYYQGSNFDPFSGRLAGGQMVMQLLNQIAADKKRKQEEAWEMEDRAWQGKQRGLTEQNIGLDIAGKQREAANYQSPMTKEFLDRMAANMAHKQRIELERVQGEEARKTAAVRTPASRVAETTAKNKAALDKAKATALARIEASFTADVKNITNEHAKSVATLRKPNAKGEVQGRTESATGSPYMMALRGANAAKVRQIKEREARKAAEIEALERAYASGDIDSLVGATIPQEVLEAARQARPDLSDAEIIAAWKSKNK